MFRASFCPSSGALYRMLLHMVFSTWCAGWCLGETACIYLVSHQCYMLSMLRSYSCDEPVFWGAFAKLRNTPLSFVMSACLSVCISSASAEGEISYWWLLWKFVEKTQTWLKSVQNIRPCTWRPKRFFFYVVGSDMRGTTTNRTYCWFGMETVSIFVILLAGRHYIKHKNTTLCCFPMLTIVTRTRSDVTLHLYCLSCFYLRPILILSSDLPPLPCLPRGSVSSGFHTEILYAFLCTLPHAQPIASWFARPVNISWEELTMMFFIKQFPASSSYFPSLTPKYLPQLVTTQCCQPYSSLTMTFQFSHPYKAAENLWLCIL